MFISGWERFMKGYVHSVESMGTVDGPGIRTVIFFQGCSLRCKYCHNPDTWAFGEGKTIEASELVRRIKRFAPYHKASGGGVTFSGGEPLMQPEFLAECLRLCKSEGIHTCIDTAGAGLGDYGEILRYTDLVLYDVKHVAPTDYKSLTGGEIDRTEKFIEACKKAGAPLIVRHVVVPGLTDGREHLKKVREYTNGLPNVIKVELLPYHVLGAHKYAAMGLAYPLNGVSPMDAELCEKLQKEFFN